MHIYRHLDELPASFPPSVATIGNFDGVHRGHRWVIGNVLDRARNLGLRSLVITFDPHPSRAIRPESSFALITPLEQKLDLLASTGVDDVVVLPFNGDLARMSAREFAHDLLHKRLNVVELHEGENFRFGHRAEADIHTLTTLCAEFGCAVSSYPPQSFHGSIVSSSRIRALIAAGDVSAAHRLLHRPFSIRSTPASGRGYGTRYTVPTINLAPYAELIPAHGVYITRLRMAQPRPSQVPAPNVALAANASSSSIASPEQNTPSTVDMPSRELAPAAATELVFDTFDAVTNVGNRPTFGADSFTIESHLLNFHPVDLSEHTPLELCFLQRLRDEQQFPSPAILLAQIKRDVVTATRYFGLLARLEKTDS